MAQATSYATIFLLSLCLAICAVGQELEFEGSAAAPDVFDLEYEFEAVDAVYETPDDDYDEETEEAEEVDEQPEDEYEEPEEDEITDEPEPPEPEEPEEVEEPEEPEEVEEPEEPEEVEEPEEDEQAEKVTESDEEAEETEDGELNVQITEEEFPGCSTFDQSAQALYLPEHVLWSVRLEDATACCEICGAYLECQMWTMDRSELLCTLLVTDGVETRQNPEWATGYKEL